MPDEVLAGAMEAIIASPGGMHQEWAPVSLSFEAASSKVR